MGMRELVGRCQKKVGRSQLEVVSSQKRVGSWQLAVGSWQLAGVRVGFQIYAAENWTLMRCGKITSIALARLADRLNIMAHPVFLGGP